MRQRNYWFSLGISMFLLWVVPRAFADSLLNRGVCFEQGFDPVIVEHDFPIAVGCEIIDCCAGCPGPGPLDWRIRLTGIPVEAVVLDFENLSIMDDAKGIIIKENAKRLGKNRIQIGKGDTILRGFSVDPKSRPSVAIPHLIMDKAAVEAQTDVSTMEFVVDQMLGQVVVMTNKIVYRFKPCRQGRRIRERDEDEIDLNNNAEDDHAVVLLDARRNSGCVNDEVWRGNDVINVGNVLSRGTCRSEVMVFSDGNAMRLDENVTVWTNASSDRLPQDLSPDLLQVPVRIWLAVTGTQARAQAEIANANLLFNKNHVGLTFNASYRNVSGNPSAVAIIGSGCASIGNLQWSAFYTPNQLNVYYVNVNGTGFNCPTDRNVIYVGTTANNQTLAHEFGHAFSLEHTTGLSGFGNNNIMWGGGVGRTHFSEGQAFRMNVDNNSTLNTNGVRTGPTRDCPAQTSSDACPALSLDAVPN